jgi:hypothetical protein
MKEIMTIFRQQVIALRSIPLTTQDGGSPLIFQVLKTVPLRHVLMEQL